MSYNTPIKKNVEFVEFVKENTPALTVPQILVKAKKQGLTTYGIDTVRRLIRDLGLSLHKPRGEKYSNVELDFLRDNQHLNRKDLLVIFNEKFNRKCTHAALSIVCCKNGFKTNHPTQFKKGFNGWRDGKMVFEMKGVAINHDLTKQTQFQKGMYAYFNRVDIGHERKDKRGFTEIRVQDGTGKSYGGARNFELKHHYLWKKHYGEIPPNHCVVFKDGNIENFDIDNLMLMPRGAINTRNALKYREQPTELKPVINVMAKLIHTTNQLEQR